MNEFGHLLSVARDAARRGAAHVRAAERPPAEGWDLKGVADYVTAVDRDTERLVGEILTGAIPDSVVLGEELSPQATGVDVVWIVDPIDGTTNYLHDYPAFAVSIAAAVDGQPVVGVVADVTRDLVYHAARGAGAWCGERRLAVSRRHEPAQALIGTGFPFKHRQRLLPAYLRQFTTILGATAGIRRAGAASLDFADVAQGRLDGFWELALAPWDVAAGSLLVREAGGMVSDLDGHEEIVRHGAFVAGNPEVHRWLLGVLRD